MSELFFVSRIGIIFYLDREWHYIAQILYSAIGIILSCEKFYFYREAQLAGLRIDRNPAYTIHITLGPSMSTSGYLRRIINISGNKATRNRLRTHQRNEQIGILAASSFPTPEYGRYICSETIALIYFHS